MNVNGSLDEILAKIAGWIEGFVLSGSSAESFAGR
jgi:hypothetical protein